MLYWIAKREAAHARNDLDAAMAYQRWYRYGDPEREPDAVGGQRRRMPKRDLVYLRRLVGVPDKGPSETLMRRWARQEAR
jgi:hypothetical protein